MALDDSYTKCLLHLDGADASTTITDENGKAWTAYGNTQIDTAQSVFGGASGLFDGVGDYALTPNSTDFNFGTGDFTVDFRMRRSGAQIAYAGIVSAKNAVGAGDPGWSVGWDDAGHIRLNVGAVNYGVSTTALSDLTWYHIAAVRYGNTSTIYVNGTGEGTGNVTGISFDSAGAGCFLGSLFLSSFAYMYKGWIDEVRVSKGIARWTANFTPPTRAYGTPAFTSEIMWFM